MNYQTIFASIFALLMAFTPLVSAQTAPLDTTISSEDRATFDNILEPINKVYTFVKYAVTLIAGLFALFAGYLFITAGNRLS